MSEDMLEKKKKRCGSKCAETNRNGKKETWTISCIKMKTYQKKLRDLEDMSLRYNIRVHRQNVINKES